MSDHSELDLSSAATLLVIIATALAVIVRLLPVLVDALWDVTPGILILTLIVWILRGMVRTFLG
jgi:hypothetical protein